MCDDCGECLMYCPCESNPLDDEIADEYRRTMSRIKDLESKLSVSNNAFKKLVKVLNVRSQELRDANKKYEDISLESRVDDLEKLIIGYSIAGAKVSGLDIIDKATEILRARKTDPNLIPKN